MPPAKVDKSIKNYLLDFGLTEKEVKLYLTLLKSGPNTIMNLARETGIKRSTTHNNIEELIKKGLVSQTNYGERRMVVAEHPEKLTFLMDQKRWDVKKLEEILPDVITKIVETVPEAKETTKVEVKYYEGKKGLEVIYRDAFSANELRSFVNLNEVSKAFPENSEIYLDLQTKNKDLKVYEIVDNSDESIEKAKLFAKNSNFRFKVSNTKLEVSAIDTLIYDNKVAVISYNKTISGIVIESQDYYKNYKGLFDYIWEIL